MAMPRPLIVFRDGRDRIVMQQQPGHGAVAPVPPPHGHFARPQRFEGDEEEIGRMPAAPGASRRIPGDAWDGHHHQQQALAAAVYRRRMNHAQLQRHAPGIINGQRPGRPQEWDGSPVARHISVTGGRLERHTLADDVVRLRQPGGLAMELDGELLAGLRFREEREEVRNSEHLKLASRASHEKLIGREYLKSAFRASHEKLIENDRARVEMSRAYHLPTHPMDRSSKSHPSAFAWEEGSPSDFLIGYGRPTSRPPERPLDASIPPGFQSVTLTCKRTRDEETEFERARLQRHRRLSGIDSPSATMNLHSLMQLKEELDQPKLQHRISHAEDDEHEDGQLNPAKSIISQYRAGGKSPPYGEEPEASLSHSMPPRMTSTRVSGVDARLKRGPPSPRYHDRVAFPSLLDSPTSIRTKSCTLRPSSAREGGRGHGPRTDQHEPRVPPKDRVSIPKQEGRTTSPIRKDGDELRERDERMGVGGEVNALFSTELSDGRRRTTKDRESRIRPLNSRAVERAHDGAKKRQQCEDGTHNDAKSSHGSMRKSRLGGEVHESPVEERPPRGSSGRLGSDGKVDSLVEEVVLRGSSGRLVSDGKRKAEYLDRRSASRQIVSKKHCPGREISNSGHKRGLQTVNVEEVVKSRSSGARSASHNHKSKGWENRERGFPRDALKPISVERERLVESKSKESEQRILSTVQEKTLAVQSKKDEIAHRQHGGSLTSKERLSPRFRKFEKEMVVSLDKSEQRHQPSSSRSAVPKPDTTSTNLRPMAEIVRQENGKITMSSLSKKSSIHQAQNSFSKPSRAMLVDGVGKPVACKLGEVTCVEDRTLITTNVQSIATGRLSSRPHVTQNDVKSHLPVLEIPDGLNREEDADQTRYLSVSISPNGIKEPYSRPQKLSDGLQRDQILSESRNLHKSDSLQLGLEGPPVATGDLRGPSNLSSLEMSPADGHDQSPGSSSKPLPKLIYTGHKTDPQIEQTVRDSASLPPASVWIVQDVKCREEKAEFRTSSFPVEWTPSGCSFRVETSPLNSTGNSLGSPVSDADPTPFQFNFSDKRPRTLSRPSEADHKLGLSVGPLSNSPTLFLHTTVQLPKSKQTVHDSESGELIFQVSEPSEALLRNSDFSCNSGIHQVQADQEEKTEVSVSLLSSCNLSPPKEVRLFGANLIAPVSERAHSSSKALQSVVKDGPTISPTPATPAVQEAQTPAILQKADNVSILSQETERDANQAVVPAGIEQVVTVKEGPMCQEQPQVHEEQLPPKGIASNISGVQVESRVLLPLQQEKQMPPLPIPLKAIPVAQIRSSSSSRAAGAHTWRRDSTVGSVTVSSASISRSTNAGSGINQLPGRILATPAMAYVRKGNSLVRAAGVVSLPHSAADPKSSIPIALPGQVKPTSNSNYLFKPSVSKNPFVTSYESSKSFHQGQRKYLAPALEGSGAMPLLPRLVNPANVPAKPPQFSITPYVEPPLPSARPKTPPQIALRQGPFVKTGILSTTSMEQQNGACPRLQLSATEAIDSNSTEVGFPKVSNDFTSTTNNLSSLASASNSFSAVTQRPGIVNRLYVRRKANQLVVAPCPQSTEMTPTESQVTKQLISDVYIKRKTNQLVRNIANRESGPQGFAPVLTGSGSQDLTEEETEGSSNSVVFKKMRLGRVLRHKKGSTGRSSWVWTLSGATVGHDSVSAGQSRKPAPLLFPWKRHSLTTTVRSRKIRTLPEGKKGSLLFLMSKRLRRVRPVQPVYTRSADGFSLHRSGVLSLGGGNLKWTKSLEKRAKQASELATKAVAEAEKRKREKKEAVVEAVAKAKADRRAVRKAARGGGERIVWVGLVRYKMDAASKTLQRIPDQEGAAGEVETAASSEPAKNTPILTPRRSIIGGTVYVRVGNGNQLVRDPKAASRALASEKVRWSLHNARSRGVKKQQYCQFFTRFGKCNKENGKCSYIHDPDKVAVCTKFLKGNCTDDQCLLTHKVIPERMPDCSYFLEGLCTNECCPYRHVNVNPKAAYCTGFLRGYCKDGDKCNKKHTYVCPTYVATGECAERPTCKFHHPKKKDKPLVPVSGQKIGIKRKGRYFSSVEHEPLKQKTFPGDSSLEDLPMAFVEKSPDDESLEFISLCTKEPDDEQKVLPRTQPLSGPGGPLLLLKQIGIPQDLERAIKPTFLHLPATPAAG